MLVHNGIKPARWDLIYCDTRSSDYKMRVVVVLVALLILCFRLPTYFAYPQFWAEDGLAWLQTRVYGVKSLAIPMAGYLLVFMHLVTLAAELLPISAAPAFYFYSTVIVTLGIVWLVMSPRFDIPFQPLAALAIVTSYQGIYALGGVANLQWILPIGACAIIFMRPSRSKIAFVAELIFLGLMSLTGPFSVFLAPILLLAAARSGPLRTNRQFAFLLVVGAGAVVQIASMLINIEATLTAGEHVKPMITAVINMPFHQLFSPLGKFVFSGMTGVVATTCLSAFITWSALRAPYRREKSFIVVFSILLFAGAVFKSGIDLNESYGLRYFYIPSVFAVWFTAFATASTPFPNLLAVLIALFPLLTTAFAFNTGSVHGDFEWKTWSSAIESGLPVTFPTSPVPWQINVPAQPSGTAYSLNEWIGNPISSVATVRKEECEGRVSEVTPFTESRFGNVPGYVEYSGAIPRWRIKGETPDLGIKLIAMADENSRVLGFGFVGFIGKSETTTWIGVIPAAPGALMKIYGVHREMKDVCSMNSVRVPDIR